MRAGRTEEEENGALADGEAVNAPRPRLRAQSVTLNADTLFFCLGQELPMDHLSPETHGPR